MHNNSTLHISSDRIIQWMNVIRNYENDIQFRILENFWSSQINSKKWLIQTLHNYCKIPKFSTIYIFGGWYGILAQLLQDKFPTTNIISVDIDPKCEFYGNLLKLPSDNILFKTADMATWNYYESSTSLVINTSTEHITQETFDTWINNVPVNIPIILQGNNFYDCYDHIRCTKTLNDFIQINKLREIMFCDALDCIQFSRFMTIGYK